MSSKKIVGKNFIKDKTIILSFILVLVAAAVLMSPILSANPGYRVRVPNDPVSMVETYPVPNSYFGTTLSGIGAGYDVQNGLYVGWCCDEHNYIYPGTTYSVRLYSTYNPLMPWPDPDWDMVNYLLNHKDPTANKDQIQSAIWYFINGGYSGSDSKIIGMKNDALAHGEGFVPQEGEICAVLCDAGTGIQHTFIEVLVPPPPCTVYVDDDYTVSTPGWGYDHFKIIQDGVDAVCYTGTVIVHDGIYYEHVIINKPIILEYGSLPIIDGGGSGDGITIAADGVTIDGFEIRNCANGISSYGTDNSIIKNNIIHDNLNTGYAGIGIMFWSDVNDFDNNIILNNQIYNNDRQGIYMGGSYNDAIISNGNTIAGNTIYNNGLNTLGNGPDNSAYGIQLSYADYNIIDSNNIYGHIWDSSGSGYWFGQGIYLNNAYQNSITNNDLHNNNYGIVQYTDGGRTVGANYVHCNEIYSNTEYGIRNYDAIQMDAECNWWGDCSGPSGVGPGTGDSVSTNVVYDPWVGFVIADAGGPYTSSSGIVTFDGSGSQASDCCGSTVSYTWNFGDGNLGSGMNPTHTYTAYGTFTVTLTVTVVTPYGTCQDMDQTTVTFTGSLLVDKTVWDGTAWVDNIRVVNGTKLNFKITIINNGALPANQITITDYLSIPQLKYLYQSSMTPSYASDNEVRWVTTLAPWQTITITYNASTVHYCYGWNSVYLKDAQGKILGTDLTKVKVVKAGQPVLAIDKQVWNEPLNTWSDFVTLSIGKALTFKITISSTGLTNIHDVTITDVLPPFIAYNYDATLTPESATANEIIWNLGEISPGDEIEITYTASIELMGNDNTIANVNSYEGYSDETYVMLRMDSAPDVSFLYPAGGETLVGNAAIQWYAYDRNDGGNLPISVSFKNVADTLWTEFPDNPYSNSGTLSWNTLSVSDGTYELQINTQDRNGNFVSVISNQFQIKNTQTPSENLAPETPGRPSGSNEGKPGLEYTYSASTIDPEGDQVFYMWDWGDGTTSDWLGPFNSGTTQSTTHSWDVKGSYSVKVKAKDSNGHESGWSDPLPITMPYTYQPLQQFLENLFARFPNLFPVLRQLFGY